MNLSYNLLSGNLPENIGNLFYMPVFDVSANRLTGEIPIELGNLTLLQFLDLSRNNLSGRIPEKVCGINNLASLNQSRNNLEGPIPRIGICANISENSLFGNKNLCWNVVSQICHLTRSKKPKIRWFYWGIPGIGIVSGSVICVLLAYICIRGKKTRNAGIEGDASRRRSSADSNIELLASSSSRRAKEPPSINFAMFEKSLKKLNLEDIARATNDFHGDTVIGEGGFGTVYRATLRNAKVSNACQTVALKKLNLAIKMQGDAEFAVEMETLGKVVHPNLVTLLGYCSTNDEKILVYEYMANGDLDTWLGDRSGKQPLLEWENRWKIAIGSARGLAFLHHEITPRIFHRDIKPSNILLDDNLDPKLADFGLARLISDYDTHVSTGLAGTVGYIPPEYGPGRVAATTKGDVYSFGVILLELVTGKRPSREEFDESDGWNLAGRVSKKVSQGLDSDVLDPTVVNVDSNQTMLSAVKIAADCLAYNPFLFIFIFFLFFFTGVSTSKGANDSP